MSTIKSQEFRTQFWDRKILTWERKRYQTPSSWPIFQSVKQRLIISSSILSRFQRGGQLLDLGCGSGFLFSHLNVQDYDLLMGIDISHEAIRSGKKKFGNKVRFIHGNVVTTPLPEVDCVVGLGLLDWLTAEEINILAHKIKCKYFLFSFSEKDSSLLRFLHRSYTLLSYGIQNSLYVPSYFSVSEMLCYLMPLGKSNSSPMIIRRTELSFGALITNLPVEDLENKNGQ